MILNYNKITIIVLYLEDSDHTGSEGITGHVTP